MRFWSQTEARWCCGRVVNVAPGARAHHRRAPGHPLSALLPRQERDHVDPPRRPANPDPERVRQCHQRTPDEVDRVDPPPRGEIEHDTRQQQRMDNAYGKARP